MKLIPLLHLTLLLVVCTAKSAPTQPIAVSGDYIWGHTWNGLGRLDISETAFEHGYFSFPRTVNTILAASSGVLWFGTDGGVTRFDGQSWKTYTTADGLISNTVLSAAVDRDGSVWFGTPGGISHFDGKTWTGYTGTDGSGMPYVTTIAVGPDGAKWFGSRNMVCHFDGEKWTTFRLFEPGDDTPSIRVLRVDATGTVWVGLAGIFGGLMRFDGVSWKECWPENVPIGSVAGIAVGPDGVTWFSSQQRLIRYDGKEWIAYRAEDGIVPADGSEIVLDRYGRIWMARGDFNVVRFDGTSWKPFFLDYPSSVAELKENIPKPILLSNTPNPFNPSTSITFSQPAPGNATLIVYDITGRKVRMLVSGSIKAGTHSVVWDGKDDHGVAVSSGVYLSRLESERAAKTAKMLLMK